jgi:hypothetical protein
MSGGCNVSILRKLRDAKITAVKMKMPTHEPWVDGLVVHHDTLGA